MKRTCFIVLLLLLLFNSILLRAQVSGDIRISPPDSDSYAMPQDACIQSMAEIGAVRLVVWGTTRNDEGDSLVNCLRFQLLRDTVFLGEQGTPHTSAARPYAFVRVIALVDRFLILWDDSRPAAPGVYMRRMSLDGTFLDEEQRIGTLPITGDPSQTMATLGDPNRGLALVWNHPSSDSSRGLHAIEFDAQGNVRKGEELLGGWLSSMLTYASLPGLTLLVVSDSSSHLVHPDGRIDSRPIPSPRLTSPFYLDVDTSLTMVSGDNLLYYFNIFDESPSSSIEIPALDSASASTILVTMDSLWHPVIYFAVASTTPVDNTRYPPPSNTRKIHYYRVDPSEMMPVLVYRIDMAQGIWDPVLTSYEGSLERIGCSNSAYVAIFFWLVKYWDGEPTPQVSTYEQFSVDPAGHFNYDSPQGNLGKTGFISGCVPPVPPSPIRTSSVGVSAVRIIVSSDTIELRAATGHFPINTMQARPGIANVGGVLLTSWLVAGGEQMTVWDGNRSASPIDLLSVPGFSQVGPGENETYESSLIQATDTIASFDGALSVCSSFRFREDFFDYQASPKTVQPREYDNVRAVLSFARSEGWRTKVDVKRSTTSWTLDQCRVVPYGWNPNRRELLTYGEVIGRPFSVSAYSALVFDTSGAFLWSVPLTIRPGGMVPIDSNRVLTIRGTTFETRSDSGVEQSGTLPVVTGTVGYMRLYGSWFLRYAFSANTCTLDRFTLDAVLDTSVALNVGAIDPFFLQDTADSTILMLYARDGVRLTRLTRDLRVIFQDSLISVAHGNVSHPAGALRNDTLFVVWEDARNIALDIYGNRLRLEPLHEAVAAVRSPDISTGISTELVRLYPNPARGAVRIDYHSSKESELEVIDPLGRIVRRMMVPASPNGSVSLSTSGIESGIYLVRLGSGGAASTARLVVAR